MASARPLRREIAVEHPMFRPFKDMPVDYLAEEFLAHIRTTGAPESFPGIHPGPLAKTEPLRKLAAFSIDRMKRPDGDMAYCPMCHQPNKYLEGALVYLTDLKAIAAIGHECAAKENRAAADKDYRARRDQRAEEDYLLANLPHVARKLASICEVRPAAVEALRVFRLLRKDAPDAVRQLRAIKQKGARLTVAETIDAKLAEIGPSGFKGSSGKQTRDAVFGVLAGTTAVINDFNPVSELNRIETVLRAFPECRSEDEALEAICRMPDPERKWATTRLRQTDSDFRKFQARMADFCAFFATANIARIDAWTQHPEHPSRFRIKRVEQRGSVILSISSYEDRFRAVIATVIESYRVEWPFADS
jgi:hypothetical protein